MEEQNQEKATATQHVKAADAAAPETGNGKKEDKGGGKKEKKTANPLTPKQLQQRKKLMVYPLMGLLFLGSMWLIFAPSEKREVNRDTVGAFNADIPLPENDGIIGDKRKAYEQAQAAGGEGALAGGLRLLRRERCGRGGNGTAGQRA